jgi:nucleoside-diphosphate-sugar epimerase
VRKSVEKMSLCCAGLIASNLIRALLRAGPERIVVDDLSAAYERNVVVTSI